MLVPFIGSPATILTPLRLGVLQFVSETTCEECGYDLRGAAGSCCLECGRGREST